MNGNTLRVLLLVPPVVLTFTNIAYSCYTVRGDSMHPTLQAGEIVLCDKWCLHLNPIRRAAQPKPTLPPYYPHAGDPALSPPRSPAALALAPPAVPPPSFSFPLNPYSYRPLSVGDVVVLNSPDDYPPRAVVKRLTAEGGELVTVTIGQQQRIAVQSSSSSSSSGPDTVDVIPTTHRPPSSPSFWSSYFDDGEEETDRRRPRTVVKELHPACIWVSSDNRGGGDGVGAAGVGVACHTDLPGVSSGGGASSSSSRSVVESRQRFIDSDTRWGELPRQLLVGRVAAVVWPPERWRLL